jgi:hypothetical protein
MKYVPLRCLRMGILNSYIAIHCSCSNSLTTNLSNLKGFILTIMKEIARKIMKTTAGMITSPTARHLHVVVPNRRFIVVFDLNGIFCYCTPRFKDMVIVPT